MQFSQKRKGLARDTKAVVLVLLAVALQWYSHSGGLLMTPDSCNYLSASKSFQESFTFLSPDGTRYDQWPPLFPIILIALKDYWYWIQLILTAWISILLIGETRKIIKDNVIAFVCQCSILLGVHLLMIGTFFWSELLFLLLLIYFIRSIQEDRFIAAIIFGFFLCLQRNAGLYFVTAAAIWLWDIRRSTILFLLGTSGFWIWNILNSKLEQEYFVWSLYNFELMAGSMMKAFAPFPWFGSLLLIAFMYWFLKDEVKLRLWCLSITLYLAGLIVLFKLYDSDDDRYFAIILPWFTILLFRAVEIAVEKQTSVVRKMLMVLIICWLMYPLARSLKNASQWHKVSFTSYFCGIQF
jgi:hypothetical protein